MIVVLDSRSLKEMVQVCSTRWLVDHHEFLFVHYIIRFDLFINSIFFLICSKKDYYVQLGISSIFFYVYLWNDTHVDFVISYQIIYFINFHSSLFTD